MTREKTCRKRIALMTFDMSWHDATILLMHILHRSIMLLNHGICEYMDQFIDQKKWKMSCRYGWGR